MFDINYYYNFTALWFFCWWFHLYSMFLPPCKGQVNTLIAHLFKLSWKRIQRSKINDNNDITQNWTLIYKFQRPPAHFPCLAHKYLTMKLPGFFDQSLNGSTLRTEMIDFNCKLHTNIGQIKRRLRLYMCSDIRYV